MWLDLLSFSFYLELVAIAAGSLSGVLHSAKRDLDLVGSLVVGIATGLGGGMLRDSLLNTGPALALEHSEYFFTALSASAIGMFFSSGIQRLKPALWMIDAAALGLFAVAGTQRALSVDINVVPAVFLGVITSVGGGVIRDILCRETPAILVRGQPYASASFLAGCVYSFLILQMGVARGFGLLAAIGTTILIRSVSAWFQITVPKPPDVAKKLVEKKTAKRP